MNDLRRHERRDIGYDKCRRGRRESPPGILGQVILVMSGQSRMMYQCLQPKPEGAIFSKRSKPQDAVSSPHDTGASIANWLESNIQGRSRASCYLMSYSLLSKEVSRTTNLGHSAYRTPKGDKGPEHAGNAGASEIS